MVLAYFCHSKQLIAISHPLISQKTVGEIRPFAIPASYYAYLFFTGVAY